MLPYISRILNINVNKTAVLCYKSYQQDQSDEPKSPKVKTNLPGPKSKALLEKLKLYQNVGGAELFGNYEKSNGNYLVDADGNIFLDLNMQDSKIPLGYNFKELSRIFSDPKHMHSITDAISLSVFPGTCCPSRIEKIVDKVSPNLPNFCLCPCDSTAVEEGLKAIMLAYQRHQRDYDLFDLRKTLTNKPIDSPKISIMSFKNSQHGSTIGALNVSNADPLNKFEVTSFGWPVADYPDYKYPLEHHKSYNAAEDRKSLAMVEEIIQKWEHKNLPVAGIIIEPLQTATNNVISEKFLLALEELCFKHGIYLMFDEIKTCCGATGKFWAHEHYDLSCPPDILTFGGKTQVSGFFHRKDLNPKNNRAFASGSISLAKVIIFETIIDYIEKHNLMRNVQITGKVLKERLLELEKNYYPLVHSTRGLGSVLAFDLQCPLLRDDFLARLTQKGLLCGKCGYQGIALRPSLTFNQNHANIFVESLESIIKDTMPIKLKRKPKHRKEEYIVNKASEQDIFTTKLESTSLENKTISEKEINKVPSPSTTSTKYNRRWARLKEKIKHFAYKQTLSKDLETLQKIEAAKKVLFKNIPQELLSLKTKCVDSHSQSPELKVIKLCPDQKRPNVKRLCPRPWVKSNVKLKCKSGPKQSKSEKCVPSSNKKTTNKTFKLICIIKLPKLEKFAAKRGSKGAEICPPPKRDSICSKSTSALVWPKEPVCVISPSEIKPWPMATKCPKQGGLDQKSKSLIKKTSRGTLCSNLKSKQCQPTPHKVLIIRKPKCSKKKEVATSKTKLPAMKWPTEPTCSQEVLKQSLKPWPAKLEKIKVVCLNCLPPEAPKIKSQCYECTKKRSASKEVCPKCRKLKKPIGKVVEKSVCPIPSVRIPGACLKYKRRLQQVASEGKLDVLYSKESKTVKSAKPVIKKKGIKTVCLKCLMKKSDCKEPTSCSSKTGKLTKTKITCYKCRMKGKGGGSSGSVCPKCSKPIKRKVRSCPQLKCKQSKTECAKDCQSENKTKIVCFKCKAAKSIKSICYGCIKKLKRRRSKLSICPKCNKQQKTVLKPRPEKIQVLYAKNPFKGNKTTCPSAKPPSGSGKKLKMLCSKCLAGTRSKSKKIKILCTKCLAGTSSKSKKIKIACFKCLISKKGKGNKIKSQCYNCLKKKPSSSDSADSKESLESKVIKLCSKKVVCSKAKSKKLCPRPWAKSGNKSSCKKVSSKDSKSSKCPSCGKKK